MFLAPQITSCENVKNSLNGRNQEHLRRRTQWFDYFKALELFPPPSKKKKKLKFTRTVTADSTEI